METYVKFSQITKGGSDSSPNSTGDVLREHMKIPVGVMGRGAGAAEREGASGRGLETQKDAQGSGSFRSAGGAPPRLLQAGVWHPHVPAL